MAITVEPAAAESSPISDAARDERAINQRQAGDLGMAGEDEEELGFPLQLLNPYLEFTVVRGNGRRKRGREDRCVQLTDDSTYFLSRKHLLDSELSRLILTCYYIIPFLIISTKSLSLVFIFRNHMLFVYRVFGMSLI